MAKPRTPRKKPNGNEALPNPENLGTLSASTPGENGNAEMKTAVKKLARKPEIVKTESRSNLIPINLEDEIRRLAYLMSERRGFEPGHETEDWLAAEHEVLERYQHDVVQTA
jgi:hypothetical protein